MKTQGAVTITVMHNIFLTKEQRYNLADGKTVETIGVSVPVWFYRGITTEPAQEVFVKYRLTNKKTPVPITQSDEGYSINMPQAEEHMVKLADPSAENPMQGKKVDPPTAVMLKDIKDGGCGFLQFKQYTKVRKDKKTYNLLHFVEIKTIEDLEDTLEYSPI
jgi:hypothetical protein